MKIDSYEVGEMIGQGGMGTVYLARHQETRDLVAVKVLSPQIAACTPLVQRFEQACSAALRLRHPYLVEGREVGQAGGLPYLVMEFVDGLNLGTFVFRHGPLAEDEALRIAWQVAQPLHLAHQHHIIHRDVKPENILLTADRQAKLTDLGLVKDLADDKGINRSGALLGTAVYLAPEQFGNARPVDPRCDVYGLGATLYYALTGMPPFSGSNLAILDKKLKNDYVPIRQIVPSVRPEVEALVRRAMDYNPRRRPSSCEELAGLLRSLRQDAAPASTPTVVTPRVEPHERRQSRRYPTAMDCSCRPLMSCTDPWPGRVLDISLTGARLRINRRFEKGTLLRVEVPECQPTGTSVWLMRVRWVRQTGERSWYVGCAFLFVPTEDDLKPFLAKKSATVVVQLPKQSTRTVRTVQVSAAAPADLPSQSRERATRVVPTVRPSAPAGDSTVSTRRQSTRIVPTVRAPRDEPSDLDRQTDGPTA
jgi:serine/threonine protein kinase